MSTASPRATQSEGSPSSTAEVLIEHGARPNLFTFAMMGDLRVVRALVDAHPGIRGLHGPHGLTLLHHADRKSVV